MNFTLSFFVLLASILLAISPNLIHAVPIKNNPGMVTLPLKRLHRPRYDKVHPHVRLQQSINRGTRKLARMTGRQGPSDEQLRSNLRKRIQLLQREPGSHRDNRYSIDRREAGDSDMGTTGDGRSDSTDTTAECDPEDTSDSTVDNDSTAVDPDTEYTANGTALSIDWRTDTAKKPTSKNSLGLDIQGIDDGYFAVILIGTPPRPFKLLMDSGSSDFWVPGEKCQLLVVPGDNTADPYGTQSDPPQKTEAGCGNHTFLGAKKSSSFIDTKKPWAITYGTGGANGTIITDNVNIAGFALDNITFGVAQALSEDEIKSPYDGIMGTGLSRLSNQNTTTPIELLVKHGHIKEAITSYRISRLADGKHDGEITFGGMDKTKFDPKTLKVMPNVSKLGYWAAEMSSVTVDGKDAALKSRHAILDTGTDIILASGFDAEVIHNLIDGAISDNMGGFYIPCKTNASVALTFDHMSFEIDTRDLVRSPIDPKNTTYCASGIVTSGGMVLEDENEWLIGDVFLKNTYFSTDVGQNQISLAKPI